MKKVTFLLMAALFMTGIIYAQNVGIGIPNPAYPLTVQSALSNSGVMQKNGNIELGFYVSSQFAYLQTWTPHDLNFATNNGGAKLTISNTNGFVGVNITNPSAQMDINGTLRIRGFGAAAGKVLTSDANGNATWQAPSGTGIGFRGELGDEWAVTPAAGEFTIHGYTEEFDDGGGFNGSAGTFTAPSAGVYQFTINLNWSQETSSTGSTFILTRLYLNRAGVNTIIEQINTSISNNTSFTQSQNFSSIVKLNAGDVINVRVDPAASFTFYLSGNGSPAVRFAGTKLY